MDAQELAHLTDDERLRYAKLEKVFQSPGWPLLVEWFQAKANEEIIRAANATTWESNRMANGSMRVWTEMANLANSTEATFAALAAQNAEAAREAAVGDEGRFES